MLTGVSFFRLTFKFLIVKTDLSREKIWAECGNSPAAQCARNKGTDTIGNVVSDRIYKADINGTVGYSLIVATKVVFTCT